MSRLVRILIPVVAAIILRQWHLDLSGTPPAFLIGFFVLVLFLIIFASFGVLAEATALAKRLGEPYGSLVLTLSVVIIEVVLIAAVMLGPSPAPTIARDSIFSVMMIILNLVVGVSIVLGARRYGPQVFNPTGTRLYLWLIGGFGSITFLGSRLFPPHTGVFPPVAASVVSLSIAVTYAVFLFKQMGRWRRKFEEIGSSAAETPKTHIQVATRKADSTNVRFTVLIVLLVAISSMAEDLAALIDFGVAELGAPMAVGGLIIAAIVFTPETLTTFRAALDNEMQRVVNLCLGAFVSTVGLTVPSVLLIGLATGKTVDFGLGMPQSVLFVATVLLLIRTYTRTRTTAVYGWAHLALFAVFGVTTFIS